MEAMILGFPKQLTEALGWVDGLAYSKHRYPIRQVLICGMGGSGIGGRFVQEFVGGECRVPIALHQGYGIPRWAGRHTLALCSSYSGNTEETLSAFEQLANVGAKVVCIASGGQLLERAEAAGLDSVRLPGGWTSPRACLGYSLGAQLAVLHAARLIGRRVFRQLAAAQRLLERKREQIRRRAEELSALLEGKIPVIYCADQAEAVALRWRQQFNENTKVLGWHHVLPEMNHNELVGWDGARQERLAVLWLRMSTEHPRTAARITITKRILEPIAGTTVEVYPEGKTSVEQQLYLVHLGDWTSLYWARRRRVDPVQIARIDYLKEALVQLPQ